MPPLDWTRQHHDPADGAQFRSQFECLNFVRALDGAFVPWGAEGDEPWVCWDSRHPDDWHEPVFVSFESDEPFDIADARG